MPPDQTDGRRLAGDWGRRACWAAALGSLLGCAPSVSTVPLGLGPLALAEREAQARGEAEARGRARARDDARRVAAASQRAPDAPAATGQPEGAAAEATAAGTNGEEADPGDGSAPAAAFEGLFAGEDVAVFRFTGFPEREQRDDKAKIRIDRLSAESVSITLINSEDGTDLCQLAARVEGNVAQLEPAQPCFGDGSEGSLEAELTEGRAVVDGDRLEMEAAGTLSAALPDQELEGELTYSFTGRRQ